MHLDLLQWKDPFNMIVWFRDTLCEVRLSVVQVDWEHSGSVAVYCCLGRVFLTLPLDLAILGHCSPLSIKGELLLCAALSLLSCGAFGQSLSGQVAASSSNLLGVDRSVVTVGPLSVGALLCDMRM